MIRPDTILAFCCIRNEAERLPHFLNYYRELSVGHFLFVDNSSSDGSLNFLHDQTDVSFWRTDHAYRLSRFGMDWLGWLQWRYGHGHWCLTIDADELLVYPECDRQNLRDLTELLGARGKTSFGAVMLDLYPEGPVNTPAFRVGDNPLKVLTHFDSSNYRIQWHPIFDNLWIQGGVRDRVFFRAEPERAPTLNKVPLVKWNRRFSYVTSTHQMLPRRLHDVFGTEDRPIMSGALLHTKFLPTITEKSREELDRKQHFENTTLYVNYHKALANGPTLWDTSSQRYTGWHQLVDLGIMSTEDD